MALVLFTVGVALLGIGVFTGPFNAKRPNKFCTAVSGAVTGVGMVLVILGGSALGN